MQSDLGSYSMAATLCRDAVLLSFEVNDAIPSLGTTSAMAYRHASLIVAACTSMQAEQCRDFSGLRLRDLVEPRHAHVAPAGRRRLVLANWH